MSKHTTGPWTVSELHAGGEKSEHYVFIEPGIAVIERKIEGQDGCDMPNALLIASAPDLLEALIALCKSLPPDCDKDVAQAYDQARAAIAKATQNT